MEADGDTISRRRRPPFPSDRGVVMFLTITLILCLDTTYVLGIVAVV